jgi:hypothetical protein
MSAETLIGVLLSMKDGLLRIGMKMVTMFSNIRERRRKDRMARDYFEEFKNTTFSFEKLFGSGHNPLVGFLEELDADGSHIQIIQSSLKGYIDRSFGYFERRVDRFDGTLDDFRLLATEFENVFHAYVDLFVKPLVEKSREISENDRLKKKFNKFVTDYEHKRQRYADYGEKVNRSFEINIIRTNFDPVFPL